MKVILGKKKKHTNDEDESAGIRYDSASVALPIFIDEYTKECDRKTAIENKVISLVTIEIAILTVFMPIIPFNSINKYLFTMSHTICIWAIVACVFLVLSIIMMGISFGVLMSAVNIQTYEKVDIEKLDKDNFLILRADSLQRALCTHYRKITLTNSTVNNKKAEKYEKGLPLTIVSFLCLLIGTIMLKLI